MRRKFKIQWFFVSILITLVVSGSLLFNKNKVSVLFVKTTAQTPSTSSFSLASLKHVTKSLAELGKMDEINSHILFLNHVPKCGSELFVLLLQRLQGINNYRHVRLKSKNIRNLSRLEQEELVYEVYDVIRNEAVPLSFDRHMYFINFTSFDKQSPTYINLIRDPVDKIVARFKAETVNETYKYKKCSPKKKDECLYNTIPSYEFTIPYFCGHDPRCSLLNNDWALKTAKRNVKKYFKVVGVLEEFNTTLEVLENQIPFFFKGAQDFYEKNLLFIHGNKQKVVVNNGLRQWLKRKLVTEFQFYEWIRERLFSQLQIIYGEHNVH